MASSVLNDDVQLFLDELNENLNYLDEAIITLEENPSDQETLNEIFRVAHTIKGSAGFLDLKNLVELGHAMENVFDFVKEGKIKVSKEIIDTILECKDTIATIGQKLSKGEDSSTISTTNEIKKIQSFVDGANQPENQKEESKSSSAINQLSGLSISDYIPETQLVRIWISPDELVPSIRAFLVQKNLLSKCDIVHQSPTEEEMDSEDYVMPESREIRFWVKSELDKAEIEYLAQVDLIDKIEVLDENDFQSLAKEKTESPKSTLSRDDSDVSDTVRLPVSRLDVMLNLIGELVIANSGFIQIQDTVRLIPQMDQVYKNIRDKTRDLVRISSDIQELVMKSRLVPISQVFNRFKRFVRDYSSKSGKKIQLVLVGENTEIDKKIIDEMIKPLTHLVRNSLDHGIETPAERLSAGKSETGTLLLKASQEGNYINVIVEDDGRGLDLQRILKKAISQNIVREEDAANMGEDELKHLIFMPGFSTKDQVDEMSGRGVGMDVVKESVENLNGTILLDTEKNQGTITTIKLPLTLAILSALIVRVDDERYSIPMSSIIETQKVNAKNFLNVENNEMVRLRDTLIPVIRLNKVFSTFKDLTNTEEEQVKKTTPVLRSHALEEFPLIVVDYHNTPIAIVVDQFISRQEMVIKSLSEHYRSIEGVSGASILGDGTIILIIDVHGIIQLHYKNKTKNIKDQIGITSGIKRKEQVQVSPLQEKKPLPKTVETKKITPEPLEKKGALDKIISMSEQEYEALEDLDVKTPENSETENIQTAESPQWKEEQVALEEESAPPIEEIYNTPSEQYETLEPLDINDETKEADIIDDFDASKETFLETDTETSESMNEINLEEKVDKEVPLTRESKTQIDDIYSITPEQFETLEPLDIKDEINESGDFGEVGAADKNFPGESSTSTESMTEMNLANESDSYIEVIDDEGDEPLDTTSEVSDDEVSIDEIESEMDEMDNFTFTEKDEDMARKKKEVVIKTDNLPVEDENETIFEKLKKQMENEPQEEIQEPDEHESGSPSMALLHFKQENHNYNKLFSLLDGKDQILLKKWLTEGSLKAINGIQSLTGNKNIYPGKIKAKKFSTKKFLEYLYHLENLNGELVTLRLPILPVSGKIYLIFSIENARNISRLLFEAAQMPAPEELDFEPLMEVTNILGSAYTNTLTMITDLPIEPGLPEIISSNEKINLAIQEDVEKYQGKIMFIENQFLWDNTSVMADILILLAKEQE